MFFEKNFADKKTLTLKKQHELSTASSSVVYKSEKTNNHHAALSAETKSSKTALQLETVSLASTRASTLTGSLVSSIRRKQQNSKTGTGITASSSRDDNDKPSSSYYSSSSSSSFFSINNSGAYVRPRSSTSYKIRKRTISSSSSTGINNNNDSGRISSSSAEQFMALHGREIQIQTWQNTILRCLKRPQLVLISGESGTGKSSLIHELTENITVPQNKNTSPECTNTISPVLWRLGGKFDAHHNLPYSIFSYIIEDLYHTLLFQASTTNQDTPPGDKKDKSISSKRRNQSEKNVAKRLQEQQEMRQRNFLYMEICSRLQEILNEDESKILIEFIPCLQDMLLLRTLDYRPELEEQENHRNMGRDSDMFTRTNIRFQLAFQKVMRILKECFGNANGRLVLVFEDLQWADKPSLELIKTILIDKAPTGIDSANTTAPSISPRTSSSTVPQSRQNSLIVIGSYRTEEVDTSHHLSMLIEDIEDKSNTSSHDVILHQMQTDNLSTNHLQSMISDLMMLSTFSSSTSPEECSADSEDSVVEETENHPITKKVVDFVQKQTMGNPLFVIQYMDYLLDWRCISTWDDGTWNWERLLDRIQEDERKSSSRRMPTVGNVLRKKFEKFPKEMQRILPWIGCLGSSFQRNLLNQVVDCFNQGRRKDGGGMSNSTVLSTEVVTSAFTKEGLIQENGSEWYGWTHDSLREAALSLASTSRELESMRYRLSSYLFRNFLSTRVASEQVFFLIGNMILQGGLEERLGEFSDFEHIELSRLYLQIGTRAIESAWFEMALEFLSTGIKVLQEIPSRWSLHYELCLDLYSTSAQAAYHCSDFDTMKVYCDEVIGQLHCPLLDKQRVYNVMLDSLVSQGAMKGAGNFCLKLLSKLGCKFPKFGRSLLAKAGLLQTKMSVKDRNQVNSVSSKVMKDPSKVWAMKLLDKLITICYFERSSLFCLAVLKALRWNEKYGLSDYSMPSYANVGLMLSAYLGDIRGGEVFAKQGMASLDRAGGESMLSQTSLVVYGYVLHWTTPYGICRKQLLKGYETGLKTGDTINAHRCYQHVLWLSLFLGNSLERLVIDLEQFLRHSRRVKDSASETSALITLQAVCGLIGCAGDPDCSRCMGSIEDLSGSALETISNMFRLYVMFYFGKYRSIVEFVEEHGYEYFERSLCCNVLVPSCTFYIALSCLTMARETKQTKYEKMANVFTKKFKTWIAKWENPNIVQYRAILDAEWAALNQNISEVVHTYNIAILMAERRGLVQDVALAHERLSDFYFKAGQLEESREHAMKAKSKFDEWGAAAVSKRIAEKYPEHFLLPSEISIHTNF